VSTTLGPDELGGHDPATVLAALRPLLGEARAARLDQVAQARLGGLAVVLENLTDIHNGGAALRSCEGVGVLDVHWVGGPDRGRPRFSERVTQGCEKWLRLHSEADLSSCAAGLKARGFQLCAAVPGAQVSLEALDPVRPTAFLIGNEHAGLTPEARALCDVEFAIPLHGFSESVNLSVATALTVYTHARRRREALGRSGDLDGAALDALRARYYQLNLRGAGAVIARHLAELGRADESR
jgi:tRNA (guanosine-2'-O-)-methyltransferase